MLSSLFKEDAAPAGVPDIHADSIREIEKMITDSSSSKISEFDLWRKINGKQDVKVYLRSLWRILEELVAHLGYRNRVLLDSSAGENFVQKRSSL